jgi:hypothetical protein
MDNDKKLTKEEAVRQTPRAESTNQRERAPELPADRVNEEVTPEQIEAANATANQTIDEGNENEVQGKAPVPHVEVMKRGSTKWTDDAGVVQKTLNDAEPNAEIAKDQVPEYLQLHQEVLDGADPLEATLRYQDRDPAEAFQEGKLDDAEKHPRTGAGLGTATRTENVQAPKESK